MTLTGLIEWLGIAHYHTRKGISDSAHISLVIRWRFKINSGTDLAGKHAGELVKTLMMWSSIYCLTGHSEMTSDLNLGMLGHARGHPSSLIWARLPDEPDRPCYQVRHIDDVFTIYLDVTRCQICWEDIIGKKTKEEFHKFVKSTTHACEYYLYVIMYVELEFQQSKMGLKTKWLSPGLYWCDIIDNFHIAWKCAFSTYSTPQVMPLFAFFPTWYMTANPFPPRGEGEGWREGQREGRRKGERTLQRTKKKSRNN